MRAAAHVLLAFAIALGAVPAHAQGQSHAGHEGHMATAAHPSRTAASRLMTPQPVIGEVSLLDQDGRRTSLREAIGTDAPVLMNFIFTTCTTICPVMSAGFAQFVKALRPERDHVRLVSISIDPETDTVDALRAYAVRFHAGPSWQFLTGTRAAVEAAQRTFGAYRGDKSNHAPATYLRRTPDSPWESVDGLSSADTLLRAFRGETAAR
jgi:protein SCO1/2